MRPDNFRPSLIIGSVFPGSTDALPRITWCTTGPFSSLPLHAAGDYYSSKIALPNLVISSYIPTLSSLRQRAPSPSTFLGILAVGNEASIAGFSPTPGVKAQLDRIQMRANCLPFTRLDGESACHDIVLKAMPTHNWVHFACHTSQNRLDPTRGVLHLHDGNLDLNTIARNLPKNAQLAYLSSCGRSPKELVPLATGLVMAGYPTVIATMWRVRDQDAPFVAARVYECLLEGGVPDSRKAATALHDAVASLREEVGMEAFPLWVPYVHLGV
ncbi:hypothetical protein FS749_014587 [Ceratobasidium sp. UAMH 11750]|nr:hypothetical protein FS749_014587 [Ceratobasidium sp. UAMH 11750]